MLNTSMTLVLATDQISMVLEYTVIDCFVPSYVTKENNKKLLMVTGHSMVPIYGNRSNQSGTR